MTTVCIKIGMIGFLRDRMSSVTSDMYEEILKPNKSHKNCVIEIFPCKTALTYKRERLVKTFCSN